MRVPRRNADFQIADRLNVENPILNF
jgi:hypothetical protein